MPEAVVGGVDLRDFLKVLELPIAAGGDAAGGLLAVQNPFGVAALIMHASVIVDVAAGGAGVGDFGVAANGTTLSDTLLDAIDLNATDTYNLIDDEGTNGNPDRVWETSEYVTGSIASGTDGVVEGRMRLLCFLLG